MLNKATEKYKQHHNVLITTKNNRDQIFLALRKKLMLDYFKNLEMTRLNSHENTQIIFYLLGFAKIQKTMSFEETRAVINKIVAEQLISLPNSPSEIDTKVLEIIPFALPLQNRQHLRAAVSALRKIFSFDKLPDTYYTETRTPLPQEPSLLNIAVKELFPLTEQKQLRSLSVYCRRLREFYIFHRLPETYFDLPQPKPPLPCTPQELNNRVKGSFPFKPKDSEDFKHHIALLRNYYSFSQLPNDYIINKKRLPLSPDQIQTENSYTFPIQDLDTANQFIREIADYYSFYLLLSKEYMTVNITGKPELP